MRRLIIFLSLIGLFASANMVSAGPVELPEPEIRINALTPTRIPARSATSTPSPTATAIPIAGDMTFGWQGEIQCYNCAPFSAKARLHHYDPTSGRINCWDWDERRSYCYSPTYSGIPWKAVWGFGAACPPEWPIGTWVDIPKVGNFICFDRGSSIVCADSICNVDLLGSGAASWDGSLTDVTLWVPLDPPRRK